MLLFYIRHGDPCYNPDSLTPLGERQAEALAKRLALYGLDRIFTSTSTRAIETAKPTCELLKKTPEPLEFLHENHAYKRLTFPKDESGAIDWVWRVPKYRRLLNGKEIRDLGRNWYDHPVFEGTEVRDYYLKTEREIRGLIEELGYRFDPESNGYIPVRPNDDRVAVFAHQGIGQLFLSAVLGIPYPIISTHFDMGHTGMTAIRFGKSGDVVYPVTLQLSNDSHLYREGLPTKYQNLYSF